MTRKRALQTAVLVLIALLPLAYSMVQGSREHQAASVFALSEAEQQLARDLAELELYQPKKHVGAHEKIYFIKVELLPGSDAESKQRQVMVTHYRYHGNKTILTRVDLHAGEVVEVQEAVNMPTGLSEEEFTLALELAQAHPQAGKLWRDYGDRLHVEAKVGWPDSVDDPALPHRDVYLLFRVGRDYLHEPRVIVDLVREAVRIEPVK